MDYQTFKNEIGNLKAYQESLNQAKAKEDELWYQLSGVKGISYDKQPTSYNPNLSEQMRLDLLDKIEVVTREEAYYQECIERYERNLNRLPRLEREFARELLIEGKTFRQVGLKHHYGHSTVRFRLKREVEKL